MVIQTTHTARASRGYWSPIIRPFNPCSYTDPQTLLPVSTMQPSMSQLSPSLSLSHILSLSLPPSLFFCLKHNNVRHCEKVRYHDEKFFYSLRPLRIFTYLSYADMFVWILNFLNAFSPYCINIEYCLFLEIKKNSCFKK